MTRQLTIADLEEVAEAYHGAAGRFAYAAFRWANDAVFERALPVPLIQFALTPYGRCVALTKARLDAQPVITIHPSAWSGGSEADPGAVLDVMIHELLHVYVHYVALPSSPTLLTQLRRSSHDIAVWAELVMKFSPRVPGLGRGVRTSPRRSVRNDSGAVVKRVPRGCIDLATLAMWPGSLRPDRSITFWKKRGIPFAFIS